MPIPCCHHLLSRICFWLSSHSLLRCVAYPHHARANSPWNRCSSCWNAAKLWPTGGDYDSESWTGRIEEAIGRLVCWSSIKEEIVSLLHFLWLQRCVDEDQQIITCLRIIAISLVLKWVSIWFNFYVAVFAFVPVLVAFLGSLRIGWLWTNSFCKLTTLLAWLLSL